MLRKSEWAAYDFAHRHRDLFGAPDDAPLSRAAAARCHAALPPSGGPGPGPRAGVQGVVGPSGGAIRFAWACRRAPDHRRARPSPSTGSRAGSERGSCPLRSWATSARAQDRDEQLRDWRRRRYRCGWATRTALDDRLERPDRGQRRPHARSRLAAHDRSRGARGMSELRIRVYDVHFGDGILVTVADAGGEPRHLLIDVGNLLHGKQLARRRRGVPAGDPGHPRRAGRTTGRPLRADP